MGHALDHWPEPGQGGRPLKATAEQVEFGLWALVQAGGSATRARELVRAQHPDWDVSRENIRDWAAGRFKARYDELRREKAGELEEQVAAASMDLAIKMASVEDAALRRVSAGLADANAVEASMILRNVTQSKGSQVEKAGQLRGNAAFGPTQINLGILFGELEDLGVTRRQADAEADAVELPASGTG